MTVILDVRNLGKHFYVHEQRKAVAAAEGVSFTLRTGELAVLSGPSGVGKSSLLKCIYRTYLASSGSILYSPASGAAIDLATAPEPEIIRLRRQEIGFVTQFLHCIPRQSTLLVVARPMIQIKIDAAQATERAVDVLGQLALPEVLWDLAPASFSGGERQRVNIARCFALRPRLILLDEPTASLDAEAEARVVDLILAAKRRGAAIVAIFHDQSLIDRLADQVVEVRRAGIDLAHSA